MSALAAVNRISLSPWEIIMMAKADENKYVGVNCGKLDQSCEVLRKKERAAAWRLWIQHALIRFWLMLSRRIWLLIRRLEGNISVCCVIRQMG